MKRSDNHDHHRPEDGDADLDMAAIVAVILSGAAIFLVLLLGARVFIHQSVASEHQRKVVTPRYHRLVDHAIEQRLLLEGSGTNPNGKSGHIPIEDAMQLVVERYRRARTETDSGPPGGQQR